jgi:hypothetical protein
MPVLWITAGNRSILTAREGIILVCLSLVHFGYERLAGIRNVKNAATKKIFFT